MTWWQVEAGMPGGRQMTFTVDAPGREKAEWCARSSLEITGHDDLLEHVQVTEIPPPPVS